MIASKSIMNWNCEKRVEKAVNENKGLADFEKKISMMITLLMKRWSVERDKSALIRARQTSLFTQPNLSRLTRCELDTFG
jgi:hypothetical protein